MSVLERLERAVWDCRVLPERADVSRLLDANKRLLGALESIAEYWNRDRNDSAMHDACWHAINTAAEALDQFEAMSPTPELTGKLVLTKEGES